MNDGFGNSAQERREPLRPSPVRTPGLNDKLNTNYIDVPAEDNSMCAILTRCIVGCTGHFFTPRQMLVVLRVLKALTLAFLVFTVASDLMYIFFVVLIASDEVNKKVGGTRDAIIRLYGLALAAMSLVIELDNPFLRHFSGFKGFIPRSFLLFFLAAITSPNPLHEDYMGGNNNNDDGADDDLFDEQVSTEIPGSTVKFQWVTSVVLSLCACCYLVMGILCVDRLKAKAFVSKSDPVKATEIPAPSQPNTPRSMAHESIESFEMVH